MKAIGPLIGFVMKETKGAADGGEVTRLIREKLGARLSVADAHIVTLPSWSPESVNRTL